MSYLRNDIEYNGGKGKRNNLSTTPLFSEFEDARLSGAFAHKTRLWLDEHGDAKIRYSIGSNNYLNTEAALRVVVGLVLLTADHWSKETDGCLQFIRLPDDVCLKAETLDYGVVDINTFEAKCCSTYFGYRYGEEGGDKKCQEMCIDNRGCAHVEIERLLSNTLGLLSPINRPDRDDFIVFHPELLSEGLWPPLSFNAKPRWLSLQKCSSSAISMDVPVPYDYLSTMHPITSEYSESMGDPQGVIVTQDGTKQYLLDHRHATCPHLSHLDLYQVFKAYGCEKKFIQGCASTPPKCLNYGYLKKDCTCACSRHFGGARCEKMIDSGPDICFENTWFFNINSTGLFNTSDVGMHLSDKLPAISDENVHVKFMQFLTVSIRLKEIGKHVHVALNHTAMQTIISKLQEKLENMIENINMTECDMHSGGLVLYWGASLSKHIRVWCFSSLLLNEPSPSILRSRVPQSLDLVFRSSLGIIANDKYLSIDSLQMQLEVSSFGVMNRTKHGSADDEESGSRSSGDGGPLSVAEALMAAGAGGIVGAVTMGVVLLATIGGLAAWMWSRADDDDDDDGGSDYSDYSSEESGADDAAEPETASASGAARDREPAAAKDDALTTAEGALAEEAEMGEDTTQPS